MIKIAYLSTPIDFGGSEQVNLNFLLNVNRNEFEIFPIVLYRPWETENLFLQKIRNAKYNYHIIPVAKKPRTRGNDRFRLPRCYKLLFRFLKRNNFDVIHTHGYFADIIGIPIARLLGIPHVSTCHGFISGDKKLRIYYALDRFFLRFSNKIIAVSDSIRTDLLNSHVKNSRIIVIKNAVKTNHREGKFIQKRLSKREELSISRQEFVIGYIGRLSEEKGIRYLIESVKISKESGIPIKALIIGSGPQLEELKQLTQDMNLATDISFLGFQTDVGQLIPSFDTFVLPSLTEGTPMALLEVMSYGIPPVATYVGGVPKIIKDNENGILVDPRDSIAIAEAVLKLFQNSIIRNRISENAKDTINNEYNLDIWCRKIEDLYLAMTKKTH